MKKTYLVYKDNEVPTSHPTIEPARAEFEKLVEVGDFADVVRLVEERELAAATRGVLVHRTRRGPRAKPAVAPKKPAKK